MYRPQKKLSGENRRWGCEKSGWGFKCPGFATTDREDGEPGVLNEGDHSARCEPNNTEAADAQFRMEIIDRGVLGSEKPLRLVADAVGDFGNDVISTLPNRHSLKRIAVNAKYRGRKRAYVAPGGGHVPGFRSLGYLAFRNSHISREMAKIS